MKLPKYLKFVRTLRCCHCGGGGAIPHHIIGVDNMGKMGGKSSDIATAPLCFECHRMVHDTGPASWPQTRWVCETLDEAIRQGVIKI